MRGPRVIKNVDTIIKVGNGSNFDSFLFSRMPIFDSWTPRLLGMQE